MINTLVATDKTSSLSSFFSTSLHGFNKMHDPKVITDTINYGFEVLFDTATWNSVDEFFLFGGSGSGKTWHAVKKVVERLLDSSVCNKNDIVIRKNFKYALYAYSNIRNYINSHGLQAFFMFRGEYIKCILNDNKVSFVGALDSERFKSIPGPTCVWQEEATELSEEDDNVIGSQLRTKIDGNHIVQIKTFNPISKQHWLYKKYFKNIDLPLGVPVFWTETTSATIAGEERILTTRRCALRTNYKGNARNLTDNAIARYEGWKATSPRFYKVYVEAEWGDLEIGSIFKPDYLQTWQSIPPGCFGFIFCDPNHSLKEKGDTTAIVKIFASPKTQKYYVVAVRCRSYSNPDDLITDLLLMMDSNIVNVSYDGNFTQEATWTHHFNNFCRIHNVMLPSLTPRRYTVNNLLPIAQHHWQAGNILMPPDIEQTVEGQRFLSQCYTFNGKPKGAHKHKDDAPDALISCLQSSFDWGLKFFKNEFSELLVKH